MDIEGQVALVSGGGSGLGEATARHLAQQGANVAILDIDGERVTKVAADIGRYAQHCDVTDAESVACGVTAAMTRFGQAPRIVVSCAEIGLAARIVGREGKVSIVLFQKVIQVNLFGTYNLNRFWFVRNSHDGRLTDSNRRTNYPKYPIPTTIRRASRIFTTGC